ncbi:major facilitator superfamily domain-containing protein 12 isoform X2 [Tripterygium wilfordii]|nr:major facilitator superfamily domain-containing protein 12 isoform X2 [Tripterygium wilfordii]
MLVAISFSSVFGVCIPCKVLATCSSMVQIISYSTSAAIFNVGWAASQVSHMSMVNCITLNSTSRVAMTSCRNAFTMVANLGLYAIAFIVFGVREARTHTDIENQYRWIAYSSIFIGCCFVVIFQLGTKEPRLMNGIKGSCRERISWTFWFKKVLYYQVALVYLITRLVQNVSQAYLAFYIINELQLVQSAKALVPAMIYICSFIVSVIMQELSWTGQRLKVYYSAGGIIWIFCGAGILLLPRSLSGFMYVISMFIGLANALMTVTAVSMQSVLVGSNVNGCAFVYGSLSFLEKMSCGFALYILQWFQRTSPSVHETNFQDTYISVTRYGMGLLPAFASLVGVVVTYTMELQSHYPEPLMESLLE